MCFMDKMNLKSVVMFNAICQVTNTRFWTVNRCQATRTYKTINLYQTIQCHNKGENKLQVSLGSYESLQLVHKHSVHKTVFCNTLNIAQWQTHVSCTPGQQFTSHRFHSRQYENMHRRHIIQLQLQLLHLCKTRVNHKINGTNYEDWILWTCTIMGCIMEKKTPHSFHLVTKLGEYMNAHRTDLSC